MKTLSFEWYGYKNRADHQLAIYNFINKKKRRFMAYQNT